MKALAFLLVVAAIALLAGWEILWRLDHSPAGAVVTSTDGRFVAQERSLPEGSELPYGHGVFVRRSGLPFWAASKLAFAAYCRPEVRLAWAPEQQLNVICVVAEGSVLSLSAPAGITVNHVGGA